MATQSGHLTNVLRRPVEMATLSGHESNKHWMSVRAQKLDLPGIQFVLPMKCLGITPGN